MSLNLLPKFIFRLFSNNRYFKLSANLTYLRLIFFRFAAAAIAAFGAISLDNRAEKVPIDSKVKFNEVAEEQALILHDNLEVRDR